MRKTSSQHDFCRQAGWLFAISWCLTLGCSAASTTTTYATRDIMIDGSKYRFVRYESKTNAQESTVLGLRAAGAQTNDLQHMIELMSLRTADWSTVDADVWAPTNSRSVVLLLGEGIGGSCPDYDILAYKTAVRSLKVRRYRGQSVRTVTIEQGKSVERYEDTPLSIREVLAARLEPRSPMYDKDLPPVRIVTMSSVRFDEQTNGLCDVVGIINAKFQFRFRLVIQEQSERVSAGSVQLWPLERVRPTK
jgi:hypothetical protein